jgi:single-stranded-DNA-specific exonuclease
MVIAAQLDELNGERQRIEVEAVEQAAATAEAEIGSGEGPPVLVLASADWHPGVVGLIAARLRERFERPSFAIALNPDGTGTGSGRSMPGVDLGSAVIQAVETGIIPKGGGHAMAAGVSLRPGDLGPFRAFLAEKLSDSVGVARAASALKIDAALTARGANIDLLHNLERAGPYGAGNPSPVFAFPAHRARFPQIVGKGGHISFSLASDDGAKLKAIAFRAAGTALGDTLMRDGDGPLHFAGGLSIDHYQGREQPQFRLIDIARPPR